MFGMAGQVPEPIDVSEVGIGAQGRAGTDEETWAAGAAGEGSGGFGYYREA